MIVMVMVVVVVGGAFRRSGVVCRAISRRLLEQVSVLDRGARTGVRAAQEMRRLTYSLQARRGPRSRPYVS